MFDEPDFKVSEETDRYRQRKITIAKIQKCFRALGREAPFDRAFDGLAQDDLDRRLAEMIKYVRETPSPTVSDGIADAGLQSSRQNTHYKANANRVAARREMRGFRHTRPSDFPCLL